MVMRYILIPLFSILMASQAFGGETYEELERQLESRNAREREQAVRQLTSRISEDRAFTLLKGAAKDTDTEVRAQVIFALGRSERKEALPVLAKALDDKILRIRKTAITSALQIGEGEAVKPVLRRLSREKDIATRLQILTLVTNSKELRDSVAAEISKVKTALEDRDSRVRKQAITVLVSVGKPKEVTAALSRRTRVEKDPAVLRHLVSELAEVKDPSSLKIVESLVQKGSRNLRHQSFKTLESLSGTCREECSRVLVRFMSNKDEEIKRMAIQSAGKCPTSRVTKKLQRIAEEDGTMPIRTAAIHSLGMHCESSPKGVRFLERFGNAPRAEIRYAAVQAMVGRSKNVRFFEKLVKGKDPEIRVAAVQGLIQIKTRASGRVFVSILRSSSDPSMRIMAARSLGHFGADKSCRKALADAAKKDGNLAVRTEAKKVLESL